jgi:hypothetical protein
MSATSVAVPLTSSSPCQSYQAGVLAFHAALVEIQRAQHRCIPESRPFGAATALPILLTAFEQHSHGETAAGFWDALACWIARPFEGYGDIVEEWDMLSSLACEEDYERTFSSSCEGANP